MIWWQLQKRDKQGRFQTYQDGKAPLKITLEHVKKAYLDGLNDHGGMILPSQKLTQYLKKNGFI